MRIALVSEFFYPSLGGIQEHLYFFAKQLIKEGHEVGIVTPEIKSAGPIEKWWPKDLPISCYRPVGRSLPFFINGSVGRSCCGFFVGRKLKKLLSPENFDLIHLHSPMVGILPVLANHFASVPVVGTFHTSFADSINFRLFRPMLQRQVDNLSKVICVSPASFTSITRIFKLEAEIIPNGVDTKLFRPLNEGPDDRLQKYVDNKLNILFMGRADPRNGLDALIKAFAQVKRSFQNIRLLIAGGGDLMSFYKSMASSLNVPDIEFLGPVRDERPELYRTADIHVFGVQRAAFAITLLEGMSAGLPIITTDFEGYEFAGTPEKHFVTSPFGDAEKLAEQILSLATNPEKRKLLATAARERALQFDWSEISRRVMDIYEQVVQVPYTEQLKRSNVGR